MALFHDERVRLADDQFEKLVELLTPGYEMAKAWQAEMAQRAAAEQEAVKQTSDDQPATFRKSAPPPDFDDPSKQGSG